MGLIRDLFRFMRDFFYNPVPPLIDKSYSMLEQLLPRQNSTDVLEISLQSSLGAEVLQLSSNYFPMDKLKPLFPGREAMSGILRGNNYSGLDIHFPENTPFTKILREFVRGAQCVLNHHDALSGHATRPAVQPQPKGPAP